MSVRGTSSGDRDPSRADYVAQRLRREILEGRYRPGSRISQEAVAKSYGTSRIPVREALRQLASDGLVVLEPDVGARIAVLDMSDLIDTYRMREVIEPMLLEQSVPNLSEQQIGAMRDALFEGEEHAKLLNVDQYLECDRRFHLTSYAGAEMPRVRAVTDGFWETVEWFRRLYTFLPRGLEFALLEHRLLLDAVNDRRPADAAALLTVHIRRTRTALAENRTRLSEVSSMLPSRRAEGPGEPPEPESG